MATVALGAPYRRLWSATLLSNLGDGIRAAAFPLLAVTVTHNPVLIAGVAVAGQLPGLLFGLAAGSLADRFDRRRLVVAVDIVRLALLSGLIGLIAGGWVTIGFLYLVVFVSGVAEVVRDTTAGTLVPSIVSPDQLDRANGRMVTAEIAGNEFVGPPLGGYLFGIAVVLPFAVNGGTLAIAVALVAGIPALVRTTDAADGTGPSRQRSPVKVGVRWLREHRTFWPVPATSAALAMTDSAWFTLLVLYVSDILHLSPAWYGVLLAVGAIGGLGGGLFAATVTGRFGARVTALGCLALAAAGQLALGTTSAVTVTAAVLATSSMAFAIWNVQARTTIQRAVPPDLLGRVTSINRTAITAASVAGAGLGGVAAHHLGLHAPFLLGLPVLTAAGLLVAALSGGPSHERRPKLPRGSTPSVRGEAVRRPDTVPEAAEYLPDWDEWGLGDRVDGEMHGDWRLWRGGDGTFVEESSWLAGRCHGTKRRYHDDGGLATVAEYDDGAMVRLVAHRSANPTREVEVPFHSMPAAIERAEFRATRDGVTYRQAFYDAAGVELDPFGAPVPERPPGVPPETWYIASAGQWKAGRWANGVTGIGLQIYWTKDGELIHVEYYRDNAVVATLGVHHKGNPLIEAYRDGDAEAVDRLIGLGLGASPGAAAHAAHEGFADLARRLTANPCTTPVLADPRVAPERRPGVDPAAEWIAGLGSDGTWYVGAVDPVTGAADGLWRIWVCKPHLRRDGYVETEYEAGTVTVHRTYEREVLDLEVRHAPDGTVARTTFHDNGKARTTRAARGDTFVREEWFDDDGARVALVEPVTAPYRKKSGEEVPVERWTAFDGTGTATATGFVRAGEKGGPIGPWQLLDPDGTERATVTFKPLDLRRRGDLGRIAEVLHPWRAAADLPGVDTVDWAGLDTFFDSARHFPFHLKGLTVPDPLAVNLAITHMYDAALHQGTIEEVTGPTVRFIVDALRTVDRPEHAVAATRFLVSIATRQWQLSAAHTLAHLYFAVPDDADPAAYFAANGTEPAYHEVLSVLEAATPLWTEWAGHPSTEVRDRALQLLAVTPGDAARAALVDRLRSEPLPELRADALLGLALHQPDDAVRAVLAEHLGGDDALLRFCAALSWLRQPDLGDNGPAADVLVAALTTQDGLDDFPGLAFSAGEVTADASTALALLPAAEAEHHVTRLGAALDEVTAINAASVAKALLDVAFPTDAYETGADLTGPQRVAVEAIVASDNAWTFNVNLAEVLRYNGLPDDRDELRALAEGRPAPPPGPRLPVVDAGISLP